MDSREGTSPGVQPFQQPFGIVSQDQGRLHPGGGSHEVDDPAAVQDHGGLLRGGI